MRRIFLVSLTLALVSPNLTAAQSGWPVYTPPDKSFKVELPEPAKFRRKKVKPKDDLFEGKTKVGDTYILKLRQGNPESFFSISVFHLFSPVNNRQFDERVYLLALIVGGDKEESDFTKRADVIVDGFHGREFIFQKGNVNGRLLFINAGRRIYALQYYSEVEGEIDSKNAARIFDTFRLMWR